MKLSDFATPSKYLAGRDLPAGGLDLVIGGFEPATMQDGQVKLTMTWQNPSIKPMVLNATNRKRLEVIFRTEQCGAMLGQRVGVYFDTFVENQHKEMVGGLRLRPPGVTLSGSGAPPSGVQTFTPGHQPNPAAQAVRERLQPPAPPPTVQDVGAGDWTQEVPFERDQY